jgi:hypothetical protein
MICTVQKSIILWHTGTRKTALLVDWINFPCKKLSSHIINMSNGRHWFLLIFCQFWMPHIDYKHKSHCRPIVPHLMLKTVIKYKQLSFFPGPRKISENTVSIQRMTYKMWNPYSNVSQTFTLTEPHSFVNPHWAGWHNCIALHSYLGGAKFESPKFHWLGDHFMKSTITRPH